MTDVEKMQFKMELFKHIMGCTRALANPQKAAEAANKAFDELVK